MANIKKIKLSNGAVYSIFDEGACRIDEKTHKLITGNAVVDSIIIEDINLVITEIDDVPVDQEITNVLTQDYTGEIKKRSTDKLLEDIGGISYSMDDYNHVLSLQIGKQEK